MVTIMGERLYTGNGSGVVAHSILRKRSTSMNIGREGSPDSNMSPRRLAGIHGSGRRFQSSSNVSSCSQYSSVKVKSTSFSSSTISRSSPHLPSSSPSRRPKRYLPQAPNKRLELALDKFSNIALPFYLQIIASHTFNISEVSQSKFLKILLLSIAAFTKRQGVGNLPRVRACQSVCEKTGLLTF